MPALHVLLCVPALHVLLCVPALHVLLCVSALHVLLCVPALHVLLCVRVRAYLLPLPGQPCPNLLSRARPTAPLTASFLPCHPTQASLAADRSLLLAELESGGGAAAVGQLLQVALWQCAQGDVDLAAGRLQGAR